MSWRRWEAKYSPKRNFAPSQFSIFCILFCEVLADHASWYIQTMFPRFPLCLLPSVFHSSANFLYFYLFIYFWNSVTYPIHISKQFQSFFLYCFNNVKHSVTCLVLLIANHKTFLYLSPLKWDFIIPKIFKMVLLNIKTFCHSSLKLLLKTLKSVRTKFKFLRI